MPGKIVISNTVLLNTGDAAILYGILAGLKRTYGDEIDVAIFDRNPDATGKYYPALSHYQEIYQISQESIRPRLQKKLGGRPAHYFNHLRLWLGAWLLKSGAAYLGSFLLHPKEAQGIRKYLDADVVISTGGTYLVENYDLAPRIFDFQLTRLLDRPLVFFTQSLGPFHQQKNIEALRPIFNSAACVLLRDERSRQHLRDIGVENANMHVVADAAFMLTDFDRMDRRSRVLSTPPRIAISVRSWKHFKSVSREEGMRCYKHAIAQFAERIIREYNAQITFLSTCQGIPAYDKDDSEVACQIVNAISNDVRNSIEIDSGFNDPKVFQDKAERFDIMIGTRMHACILSLTVGTPVLPIAYEFKTEMLARRMGAGDLCMDIESVTAEELACNFAEVLNDYKAYSRKLIAATKEMSQNAWSAFDHIHL